MSEHDIDVEEIERENTLKEKRLQDMKKKIEAMQKNITNKRSSDEQKRTNPHTSSRNVEPISITDHMHSYEERSRSPINNQSGQGF